MAKNVVQSVKTEKTIMTLETFCAIKKYGKGIEARLRIFMAERNDRWIRKPEDEWDKMYSDCLNRVTK